MFRYKNYYTLTALGKTRHTYSLPRGPVRCGFYTFVFMFCFSLFVWTFLDLSPLKNYQLVSSQNQLLRAKTYILYQKNYDLAGRDSLVGQEIKILEAMINSEDENAVPLNPAYKMVSIEEQNIGWRIFQYKVKIGDRVLYEYVADRKRPQEHQALKEKLGVIQKNIEKLIQTRQFAPEIKIVELADKEFLGLAGDLIVLTVSKQDALQLQMDGAQIAEQHKKTLQRELKIAKENKLLQETPLTGSIRVVGKGAGLEELRRQIELCQRFNSSLLNRNTELVSRTYNKVLDYRNNYARTPSMYPLRYVEISSPYGYRVHPVTNRMSVHYGLDMATPEGTKVIATADGRVTYSGWSGSYGYMVQIYHGMGISTIYGHCSELFAGKGQHIKKGAVIALSGSTGMSNGPHLHYEIRRWNVAIDPTPYLRRDILSASKDWNNK
ncbi:MAG: M23 family metallopeptidase [Candidatus Margulisbacteria bacterium]|jgi:murein DD-endopeptidase MepM/ murein hydrolase activator NlpD|nr:M23 family metallopeptidase [Candidatus Margulisiibacteriota bacterium]